MGKKSTDGNEGAWYSPVSRAVLSLIVLSVFIAAGTVRVHAQIQRNASAGLPNLYNSAVALGDYDNDGYLDIAILGSSQIQYAAGNGAKTRIYHNNGNGTYTDIQAGLDSVYGGSIAWGDYDNDGKLDLIYMGGNSSNTAVTILYHNDGNGVFTKNTNTAFQGSQFGTVAWVDFNNDGFLDFYLNGYNTSDTLHPFSKLYKNNGDGTFTEMPDPGIDAVNGHAKIAWGDYDNDGYPDVAVCGREYPGGIATPVTKIYHNNKGDGTFTEDTSAHFVGVWIGTVAWGDFNNDGLLDLALTGATTAPQQTNIDTTIVYRNNGDGTFSYQTSISPGTNWASLVWGDFNNDGLLDLYVSGWGGGEGIYINEGNGTFSQLPASEVAYIASGQAAVGDLNNDGDLDIVATGQDVRATGQADTTSVMMSTIGGAQNTYVANTAPVAPTNLHSSVTGSDAKLAWGFGDDNQSPVNGLSYNLRVGTTPAGIDVISPMSGTTGFRRLPRYGQINNDTTWTLKGLPTGMYYWSAQSVDQAYAGSPFPTEGSFMVGPVAQLAPTSLNFDSVAIDASKTDSIKVMNTGTTVLNIVGHNPADTAFALVKDTLAIPVGDSAWFAVKFAPKSVGAHSGNVVFTSNTIKGSDTVTVSGTGYNPIVVTLSVTPKSIVFDSIAVGLTEKGTLKVMNTGNDSLMFWARAYGDTVFTVPGDTSTVAPGDSALRDVTFAPKAAGNFNGLIVLSSNATPGLDTVMVSGRAYVPAAAEASVKPKAVAFDTVLIHVAKVDTVVVSNIGNAPLTVFATITGAGFATRSDTATVAAGDSAFFPVTFTPVAVTSYAGTLVFTSNGVSAHDTVTLAGHGSIMNVLQARQAAVGSVVAFNAYVTRAFGNYIYVQDSVAGMTLYAPTGALLDTLKAGALTLGTGLQVVGVTSAYSSLLEMKGSDMVYWQFIASSPSAINPIVLTLADIKAHGEDYEARLIQVRNLSLVGSSDVIWLPRKTYNVTDPTDTTKAVSLRIGNATDTQVDSMAIPAGHLLFTGVLGQFSSSDPAAGYQLTPVDSGDIAPFTSVAQNGADGIPTEFALQQNYPNPFNPTTTIAFSVPKQSRVSIEVYNILGQLVSTLVNDVKPAGNFTVRFDATNLSSGIYLVRMVTPQQSFIKKMMLVK
jgi:hypothetical protein